MTTVGDAQTIYLPLKLFNNAVRFDGTGDWLTAIDGPQLNVGAGDFTIECWVNRTATASGAGSTDTIISKGTNNIILGINVDTSKFQFSQYGVAVLLISTTVVSNSTWYYVAITRAGTTLRMFINGTQEASTTSSANFTSTTNMFIGADANNTNQRINGYIEDLRITKGVARYIQNFAPPTAVLTSDNYTTLLINPSDIDTLASTTNNTFLDSSTNNFTITRTGTPTQGAFTPYRPSGYWSNYLNQSSAYLTFPLITLGATFTVEGWFYATTITSGSNIFVSNRAQDGGTKWLGFINSDRFAFSYGGTNREFLTTINLNTWYHFAFVITSSTVTCYLNGAQIGTTQAAPTSLTLDTISGYGTGGMIGYLSNFRIVDGVAVYTGAFTPSTSPLQKTQSSGTNISAITGSQTSLLTCQSNRFIDNSNGAIAITPSGTPLVQAFQPFSPAASYAAATYGGSGYFAGGSNYLGLSTQAALPTGTQQFTVEFWAYKLDAWSTSTQHILNDDGSSGFQIWVNTGGSILRLGRASVAGVLDYNYSNLQINTWTHFAYSRKGNDFALWVNGSRVATVTDTNGFASTNGTQTIGGYTSNGWNGYLSNIRVVKGSYVYDTASTSITVPTTPVTAITNTSLLTNFDNAGIYDAAWQNLMTTVGDAQVSTTQKQWGTTSMKFDGTGDYLTWPAGNSVVFGTGDFTVEAWAYFSSNPHTNGMYIIDTRNSGQTGNWGLHSGFESGLIWFFNSTTIVSTSTVYSTGTWYYFAYTRSSNTGRLYVNGTQVATGADSNNYNIASTIAYIGGRYSQEAYLNGYIQDLRITKGVARTITTPTAAFPTL
jgi:hypothetical protein